MSATWRLDFGPSYELNNTQQFTVSGVTHCAKFRDINVWKSDNKLHRRHDEQKATGQLLTNKHRVGFAVAVARNLASLLAVVVATTCCRRQTGHLARQHHSISTILSSGQYANTLSIAQTCFTTSCARVQDFNNVPSAWNCSNLARLSAKRATTDNLERKVFRQSHSQTIQLQDTDSLMTLWCVVSTIKQPTSQEKLPPTTFRKWKNFKSTRRLLHISPETSRRRSSKRHPCSRSNCVRVPPRQTFALATSETEISSRSDGGTFVF